jgi:DNA-binding CsgD family transcriptional regulator
MLTEREFEILMLVAEDYTNKEISEKLFIAPVTVDTHKKNIMAKLGVKNALGLAVYLVKHKIIE